jgi:hypothetical protein
MHLAGDEPVMGFGDAGFHGSFLRGNAGTRRPSPENNLGFGIIDPIFDLIELRQEIWVLPRAKRVAIVFSRVLKIPEIGFARLLCSANQTIMSAVFSENNFVNHR